MKYLVPVLCVGLILLSTPLIAQDTNPADFDSSGMVDFTDFLLFAQGFGKSTGQDGFDAKLDLDGSGTVDFPDFLQFVSAFTGSTGTTDPTPTEPEEILLYIADLSANKVEILNTDTNLLDPNSAISAGQPRGVGYSTLNNQIFIAGIDTFYALSSSGQRQYAIPLHTGDSTGTEPRGGFKVVLSPDQKTAFLTESEAALVEVFNTSDGRSLAQIPVPPVPSGIAISPNGQEVYVAHGITFFSDGNHPLSVLDGINYTFKDSIPVGESVVTRMAISPDGQRLYLNNAHVGIIDIVDLATRSIVDSITVGQLSDASVQVFDLTISKDGSLLFAVVNRTLLGFDTLGNATFGFWGGVVVIDTSSGKILHEIQVGQFATAIGVTPNGKMAYVAGAENLQDQGFNNLQVFIVDLDAATSLGSVRGLSLPVDLGFNASKPAIPNVQIPDLIIF